MLKLWLVYWFHVIPFLQRIENFGQVSGSFSGSIVGPLGFISKKVKKAVFCVIFFENTLGKICSYVL